MHDAQEIAQLLDDPRAAKLFEHAALYVDSAWQHAEPQRFAYCQGMAAMLNLIARMPEYLSAQAKKELDAQERVKKSKEIEQMVEEIGTVDRGLDWFRRNE